MISSGLTTGLISAGATRHAPHDLKLFVGIGIADRELEHEAIDLRFRQRVRALLLDRILSREHQERIVELVRVLADRDGVLLHGLQQRGLHLRGRAVDFIGQNHVREDRPLLGLELLILRIVDQRPDQVCGKKIRGELKATELRVDRVGERTHRERLRQARNALHEHVAVSE